MLYTEQEVKNIVDSCERNFESGRSMAVIGFLVIAVSSFCMGFAAGCAWPLVR